MDWNESVNYFIRYNGREDDRFVADECQAVRCRQTHSDNVRIVTAEDAGKTIDDCDGLITDAEGVCLVIKTADCVPVTVFDDVRGVVANIHAGWRGTAKRIVEKAVRMMEVEFGCEAKEMKAMIGPSIGGCCFEVGDEVVEAIGKEFVVKRNERGRAMLDLKGANVAQLVGCGLRMDRIGVSSECTCCSDVLPSFRRDGTGERIETWAKVALINKKEC